ncbi:zinc-binding dehydrogenase [Nocardioides sp. SYSU D00038]|uniref:zinc-binding dehydrogenase n=1 Tax=Nocardioides sp. SYSU D00038 TaxID=2812554 RepID=UPI0019677343|nr:zinc-binding dehydrogenase [Nocardioides sp. SYSU D00038]
MKAIRLHVFGPPSHLVLDELPDLAPAAGQVRIEVHASGVHLLDVSLRRGEAGGPLPPPELPTIPGREVAGVVDAVGEGVDERWLGERVVAHLGMVPGGYAEQAVTAVANLLLVPDHVTFPDAVAAVGTGRTALGVVELEPPGATDTVLVPSAAGGLGWLLVQSARAAGARVVAAAGGPERVEVLGKLGADLVVDYSAPDWVDRVRVEVGALSLVYDGVGGAVGRSALELLGPGGRLVMFGFSAGAPTEVTTADLVGRGITAGWSLGPRMQALPGGIPGLAERALARVAAGEWEPLTTTYPLADAARAHDDLEGRRALGKVVLLAAR